VCPVHSGQTYHPTTGVFAQQNGGCLPFVYYRECLEAPCRANRLPKVDSAFRAPLLLEALRNPDPVVRRFAASV